MSLLWEGPPWTSAGLCAQRKCVLKRQDDSEEDSEEESEEESSDDDDEEDEDVPPPKSAVKAPTPAKPAAPVESSSEVCFLCCVSSSCRCAWVL